MSYCLRKYYCTWNYLSVIVAPKMVTCFFCCSVSLLTLCFLLPMLPIVSRLFLVGTSYIDSLKPLHLQHHFCQFQGVNWHVFTPETSSFLVFFFLKKPRAVFWFPKFPHIFWVKQLPMGRKPNPRKSLWIFLRFGLDDSWLLRFDRWFNTPRFELLGLFKGSDKLDMDIDHEHDCR